MTWWLLRSSLSVSQPDSKSKCSGGCMSLGPGVPPAPGAGVGLEGEDTRQPELRWTPLLRCPADRVLSPEHSRAKPGAVASGLATPCSAFLPWHPCLPLCPVPPWEQGSPCSVCPQEGARGQVWLCLAHSGPCARSWLTLARGPEDSHSLFFGGASFFFRAVGGRSMVTVDPKEEVMGWHILWAGKWLWPAWAAQWGGRTRKSQETWIPVQLLWPVSWPGLPWAVAQAVYCTWPRGACCTYDVPWELCRAAALLRGILGEAG